ncbi:MAG: hypothetical protein PHV34_17550 [Verrucomicrobiae bacterium]|nr:hypothetical protein [Verrucomicrobiae bacterium]
MRTTKLDVVQLSITSGALPPWKMLFLQMIVDAVHDIRTAETTQMKRPTYRREIDASARDAEEFIYGDRIDRVIAFAKLDINPDRVREIARQCSRKEL